MRTAAYPAVLALFAFLLLSCATEVALDSGIDPAAIENRAQWMAVGGLTRAELVARVGEAWISDARRRVDVFRVSEKQHNALVVFAPYPVPVPSFSRRFSGYSLVSYGEDGRIDAADSAFAVTELFGVSDSAAAGAKPMAVAGDYAFVHPSRGPAHTTLAVSHTRYLSDRATDPAAAQTCTLVTVCDPAEPGGNATDVCWTRLRVDDEDYGDIVRIGLWEMLDTTDARARAKALVGAQPGSLRCTTQNYCMYLQALSVPVLLPPGNHRVEFRNNSVHGRAEGSLACAAGELWYASFRGGLTRQYDVREQLSHGFDLGEAEGRLRLSREPPADRALPPLLLYYAGEPLNGRGLDR